MRHGSIYAVHNRGPPSRLFVQQRWRGRQVLSSPHFIQWLEKAVGRKIKGSNRRCDPTVRAL